LIILDYASYHVSHKVKAYAKKNAHRLKLHFTLKYTPNDNIAEAQWPSIKAAVANKQIQSHDHIAATIGKAFESGEITPVTPYSYTRVTTRRIGKKEAGEIKAKIGKGEHFCYKETMFNERVRIPTAEDLRERGESVLPAKKRAELPHRFCSKFVPLGLPLIDRACARPACATPAAPETPTGAAGPPRPALSPRA